MKSLGTMLLGILIFVGILTIIYIIYYNNIQAYKIKINEAESMIDELLRKKFDLLNLIKEVIFDETKVPKKAFDEFKKIKDLNISSFDFERKLTDYNILIDKIKDDYEKLVSDSRFSNYYEDIYELNEKLEASKAFYNKYTTMLNKLIKKFPSNVIAHFHHINARAFFDGKDMFDDDINDFKI